MRIELRGWLLYVGTLSSGPLQERQNQRFENLVRVWAGERELAGQPPVEDDTQGPDVGAAVEVVRFPPDLLLLLQVVPLSLLLGVSIDQEPSIHVSLIRRDVKQHFTV